MKKLLLISAIAVSVYACQNTAKVSESGSKVAEIKNWVDSIKSIVDTTTHFDAEKWMSIANQFQDGIAGVDIEELDETTKAEFEKIQENFKNISGQYQMGVEKAKQQATELINGIDSSALKQEINDAAVKIDAVVDPSLEKGGKIIEMKK